MSSEGIGSRWGKAKKLPPGVYCSLALLRTLLLISGVEPNPGPSYDVTSPDSVPANIKQRLEPTYWSDNGCFLYSMPIMRGKDPNIGIMVPYESPPYTTGIRISFGAPHGGTNAFPARTFVWVIAVPSGPYAPDFGLSTRVAFPTENLRADGMTGGWYQPKFPVPNYPAMFDDSGLRHSVSGTGQWTIKDAYNRTVTFDTVGALADERIVTPYHADDIVILVPSTNVLINADGQGNGYLPDIVISKEALLAAWGGDCRVIVSVLTESPSSDVLRMRTTEVAATGAAGGSVVTIANALPIPVSLSPQAPAIPVTLEGTAGGSGMEVTVVNTVTNPVHMSGLVMLSDRLDQNAS